MGEKGNINYRYDYDHIKQVEERLLLAGVRLAGVLNEIFE
ncbi:MAG: S1/P1 nuclease [Bacteroidota bacterium]